MVGGLAAMCVATAAPTKKPSILVIVSDRER
jgi:hypothetical protein